MAPSRALLLVALVAAAACSDGGRKPDARTSTGTSDAAAPAVDAAVDERSMDVATVRAETAAPLADAAPREAPAPDRPPDAASVPDVRAAMDAVGEGAPRDAAPDAADAPPRDASPDTGAPDATVDAPPMQCGRILCDCTFNGKQLWGRVQIVTSFPDVKIRMVTAFPDLEVQRVTAFPDSCGKWQEVTSFPDLKVQMVTAFEDFSVEYVTAFPGIP